MKVLIWAENFLPFVGGAEILLSHLLPALSPRGINFEIITSQSATKQAKHELWRGIPIHRFNFQEAMMGDLQSFKSIRGDILSLFGEANPDLIHVHTTGPSLFLEMQTHSRFKYPRLLTVHAFFSYPPKEDGYLRKYLPQIDYLNGVSKRMTDLALALFPKNAPRHETIYNGLPHPKSPTSIPEEKEDIALILSRLSREKGVDLAIQSMHHIRKRRQGLKLWIAGEGPERGFLEKLASTMGLKDRIDFLGLVPPDRVYDTIARCKFLVMPSRFEEGLGLSALQAAHMGKPVIGARRGGLPEIIRDGETGLLFEPEDWQGLAAAMERLLDDPGLCQNLGRNAQRLAKTQFDFTAMVDAYERIYRQLAPGK